MWISILIIVGIIVFKFLYDTNSSKKKISSEGGMINKFSVLINLLNDHPRSNIIQDSGNFLTIGVVGKGVTQKFILIYYADFLEVKYETRSKLLGSQNLKWRFSDGFDQEKAYERICKDIYSQNKKLGII